MRSIYLFEYPKRLKYQVKIKQLQASVDCVFILIISSFSDILYLSIVLTLISSFAFMYLGLYKYKLLCRYHIHHPSLLSQ